MGKHTRPPVSETGRKTSSNDAALITLGSRHDLPPRARSVLEGVLSLCASELDRSLASTFDEFEQQLFKLAEKGRSNELQSRCFETLREVKRSRADVAPRFRLALESTLARFDKHAQPSSKTARKPHATHVVHQELSLVETGDLEESLALQDLAAKAEIRQTQALYALGHRFGVLAGAPVFDAAALPIGPVKLGHALRHAAGCLDISAEHRVLLYHTFDRMVMSEIATFYAVINDYLIEQHILKNLRTTTPRSKGISDDTATSTTPDTAQAVPSSAHQDRGAAVAASSSTPLPTRSNNRVHGAGSMGSAMPGTNYSAAQMGNRASTRSNLPNTGIPMPDGWSDTAATHPPGAPTEEQDSALFTTLRELMSGRRRALGLSSNSSHTRGHRASGEEIESVLGTLQSKPITTMVIDGKATQRSITHLKQDLLAGLRQLNPDGRPPQLPEEDADTIDLVGMLFDYITKQVMPNGSTQTLLTKLQVPLLRIALHDKGFFTRRTHPARQLLNTIAEIGIHWIEDKESEADHALVEKLQLVVDQIATEFDGSNLDLLETTLSDLSQHMRTVTRKAEVTERRHVDAAKGREKLDMARARAGAAISERVAQHRPGKLVRTVLEQAWTDVLALTLLRQGEDSDSYRQRLAVADQLIATSMAPPSAATPVTSALREEVETGLSQVGLHHDDIQAVVKKLFLPEPAANEDAPDSHTELALKLKNKVRLGEDTADGHPVRAAAARKSPLQLNPEEQKMLEHLKTLPYGTWFEFITNQQGEKVRRKLAWFSTLTSRCLFVNQRGARTEERTLEQLAREVVQKQASVIQLEQGSLVDRAWNAIVSSFKNLVGQGTESQPLPA